MFCDGTNDIDWVLAVRQETFHYLLAEVVKEFKYWRYYVRARMFFFLITEIQIFTLILCGYLHSFRVLFSLFIDLNQTFFAFSRITVIIINVNRVLHLINFAMTTSSYVGKTCQKLSPCIRLFGIN